MTNLIDTKISRFSKIMKRILRCLVFASAISFALAIHLKPPKRKGKAKAKAKGNGGNKTANEPPVRETQAQKQERFRTETKMKKIEEIKKEFRDRFEIIQAAIRKSNAENVTKKLTQENLIKIQEKLIEQKLIDPKRDTIPLFDPRTLLFDVAYGDEPLEELSPVYAEYGLGPLGKVKYPSKSMTGILKAFPSFESVYPGISDVGKVCVLTPELIRLIRGQRDDFPPVDHSHKCFVRQVQQMPRAARKAGSDNDEYHYELGFFVRGKTTLVTISWVPKRLAYFCVIDQYFFDQEEDILAEETIYKKFTPQKDTALFPKWHAASWKDKLILLDKFEDERMISFGKKIIYQESPETLPADMFKKIKRGIAERILSDEKEKWWTCKEFYFECDNLREKYGNEKDEEKLKFLDEINEFVEGIQKKYENA